MHLIECHEGYILATVATIRELPRTRGKAECGLPAMSVRPPTVGWHSSRPRGRSSPPRMLNVAPKLKQDLRRGALVRGILSARWAVIMSRVGPTIGADVLAACSRRANRGPGLLHHSADTT